MKENKLNLPTPEEQKATVSSDIKRVAKAVKQIVIDLVNLVGNTPSR